MDVTVYLPDEIGAWFEEHRAQLGRGWASRVLRDAVIDERERMAGAPMECDEDVWRALRALTSTSPG